MSGTRIGGRKAAITNKQRYKDDFYRQIGRKGGVVSRGGGFTDPEFASAMGKIGGATGRRGVAKRQASPKRIANAKSAPRINGKFAKRATLTSGVDERLRATYGSLDAYTVPVVIHESVPGWLYAIWIIGTALAIFASFFLGSIAYRA